MEIRLLLQLRLRRHLLHPCEVGRMLRQVLQIGSRERCGERLA